MKGKPPNQSSDRRRDAQRNLERCLEALDRNGEDGLQAELDRIYPGTNASPLHATERVQLAGMKDCFAIKTVGRPLLRAVALGSAVKPE